MKYQFIKETVPPRTEQRNELLKKLVKLPKDVKFKKVKLDLRNALDSCNGYTNYYYIHGPLKIFIGDETTPKKLFKKYMDRSYVGPLITKYRKDNRKPLNIVGRSRMLRTSKVPVYYERIGNVMVQKDTFGKLNKKVKREKVFLLKTPTTPDPYIGIELEYATKQTHDEIADAIVLNGLQEKVRIMHDYSINPSGLFKNQSEICVLTKFSELSDTIVQLKKIINPDAFLANNSCGLHVHLDMRNLESPALPYKNLVVMQNVLFGLAADHRRENRYCIANENPEWNLADTNSHYYAISASAYYKHRTLEVRIHQGTEDLDKVEKWIRLLQKIAYYTGDLSLNENIEKNIEQLKTKINIDEDLMQYVGAANG